MDAVIEKEKNLTPEESSLQYFNGDELASITFINKYALRDKDSNLLEHNPDDMHDRLASEFFRIEKKYPNGLSYETIFDLLKNFKYLVPQGSPMFGIGNSNQIVSLSNCFVIGNDADSYGGILKVDEEQTQLMKRRGGVGHDLTHIRPSGSVVHNSALTSTGLKPFMQRYSNSTREVAQGGRRGALMLSLDVSHPDVESFVDAKMNQVDVTGANVSLRISDEFMKAVESKSKFNLRWPTNSPDPKYSIDIDAKKLWDKVINNVWSSAEPGILFWDQVIKESPADCYTHEGFKTVSTNPCGELPLCTYDSCRLLAINLYSYVKNPFTPDAELDFELLADHAQVGQRLMDDMIDMEIEKVDSILNKIKSDPEDENLKRTEFELWTKIKEKATKGRRTGLGVTAEGDTLAALGLRYGSDEGIDMSEKIHKVIAVNSYKSSINLAKERGSFPIFDPNLENENPFVKRILNELSDNDLRDYQKYGRRNIANLTIAPTGTVSIMTQTTSGIEPAFLINYTRRKKVNPNDPSVQVDFVDEVGDSWSEHRVFHKGFLDYLNIKGINPDDLDDTELQKKVKKSPYYKSTSADVDWVSKVKLQGRVQKWVDHSISVTVNVPNEATKRTVDKVYREAWKAGCKGVTLYRDGSRSGVLISNENKKEEEFEKKAAVKRPKELECDIWHRSANGQPWMIVVGKLVGKPYEIFAFRKFTDEEEAKGNLNIPASVREGKLIRMSRGKYDLICGRNDNMRMQNLTEFFESEEEQAVTRLVSATLRHRMGVEHIVDQLTKVPSNITSFSKVIGRVLKQYIADDIILTDKKCSECGDPDGLIIQDGCLSCVSCGYAKCN